MIPISRIESSHRRPTPESLPEPLQKRLSGFIRMLEQGSHFANDTKIFLAKNRREWGESIGVNGMFRQKKTIVCYDVNWFFLKKIFKLKKTPASSWDKRMQSCANSKPCSRSGRIPPAGLKRFERWPGHSLLGLELPIRADLLLFAVHSDGFACTNRFPGMVTARGEGRLSSASLPHPRFLLPQRENSLSFRVHDRYK